MHNQFKTQKFKHLMLAMGPRDLNSAPYSPVHCSSHSMTSFQSSELTELPVVENSQLFAQRAHSARYAPLYPPRLIERLAGIVPWSYPTSPCASTAAVQKVQAKRPFNAHLVLSHNLTMVVTPRHHSGSLSVHMPGSTSCLDKPMLARHTHTTAKHGT